MTMIDDGLLSELLSEAAATIEAPAGGAGAILEKARRGTPPVLDASSSGVEADGAADEAIKISDDPIGNSDDSELIAPSRRRQVAAEIGRHRILSVAAAVVVVTLGVVGGLSASNGPSPSPVVAGRSASPSTTIPPGQAKTASPTPSSSSASGVSGSTGGTTHGGSSSFGSSAQGGTNLGTVAPNSAPSLAAPGTSTNAGNGTAPSALPNSVGQSARIEQTGSLSLTVGKGTLAKTMSELSFLASAYNGFVQSSQSQSGAISSTSAPSGSITLEVPVDSFTGMVKKAQSLGKTDALSTKATDVTGQYVDLQSRISALQDSLKQYETIMSRTTSIGDVLSVQAQIDSIQTQIEQEQGQLNVLSSETNYSTLTVVVSEGVPPIHHQRPPHRSGLSTAWHDSVHGFVTGVEGLIRIGGPVLFALLCALVVLFGGRAIWRRVQRHRL